MRNISFSLTKDSFCDGSKNVTRRIGWNSLRAGDHLMAVEQGQGLKKGEHVKKLGEIRILNLTNEPLTDVVKFPIRLSARSEVEREGFPAWKDTPEKFVKLFCKVNKCKPETIVKRIFFVRV